jgi:hypothetical protein
MAAILFIIFIDPCALQMRNMYHLYHLNLPHKWAFQLCKGVNNIKKCVNKNNKKYNTILTKCFNE